MLSTFSLNLAFHLEKIKQFLYTLEIVGKYIPTIGLEIHAELATQSKMFCACKNDPFVDTPNLYICPVCTAQPGAIPVPNKKAIESMIKIGLAVGGTIANYTEFDRKSYFYPDIPKGYQISQYKYPIVSGGELAGVQLTRIHLEEDTGTSEHHDAYSLINYNRAGVPLMELVTEPVIHDAETAMKFAKELQLLLRALGVAHANMEKGEMRVEVNISVSDDEKKLGTKVEIKNIASISFAGKAIAYEIERMTKLLEEGKGDEIVQETRGWDDVLGKTFSQRKKEGSADYRYFPDPDIPPFQLHELFDIEQIRKELPPLPWELRDRFKQYGLKIEDAETLIAEPMLFDQFTTVLHYFPELFGKEKEYDSRYAIAIANFILTDLQAIRKKDPQSPLIEAEEFAVLVRSFVGGEISSRVAKDLIPRLVYDRINIKETLEKENLIQKSDPEELKKIAQKIIDANPKVVEQIKGGKDAAIMSLVGQIMKETKGSANPELAQKILKELIK